MSSFIHCDGKIVPKGYGLPRRYETEWVLLTSGTTGVPKLVVHTLASLAGAIGCEPRNGRLIWSTFYDIRRYGGLQILLRAILTGSSLLLSNAQRIDRRLPGARRRAWSNSHLRHTVALATRPDEFFCSPDCTRIHSFIGRDCGSGNPQPSCAGLSAGTHRSRLCHHRSRSCL